MEMTAETALNFPGSGAAADNGMVPKVETLVQGSGEMADLFRLKDWSKTPLGPIESWSETLLATVNLLLFSPFPFAAFWGEEQTLLYNDGYRSFLGPKHPAALGERASAIWREAWDALGPPIEAAFRSGEVYRANEELIPILVDGALEDRWWTYAFYPVYEYGRIVAVANPSREETGSILARKNLEASEDRARIALAAAHAVGTWDWDIPNGRVFADESFARLYGVSPESAVHGAPIEEFFRNIHPDDMPLTNALIERVLKEGGEFSAEYRVVQPDGSCRWVAALGRCSFDDSGRPLRFPGVSVDITEKKQNDQSLIRTEKLAAVGKLAASIAHEVNNPLESVMNLLYLARHGDDREEVNQYLDAAERELRRVAMISTQTLRFYKQLSRPMEVACDELFDTVLSIFQGRIVNAHIQVEKRKRARRRVMCFDGEIRQVLNNLVGNAIDALQGTRGRLLLRSREGTNWATGKRGLILTVADTAGGMPPAVQKRIFEPFFTTKGIGGTGLGLWVSEEIVHRHHGTIRVRSSMKEGASGTVFAFFLPFDAVVREERSA